MLAPADVLGARGPLAAKVPGFAPRRQQQEMAQVVAETMDSYSVLITEAGTGTGKTFAYVVPALLSGKKVIISTGTRHLQDQLFYRDLPLVRDALGISVSLALLKGRANYFCLHRMGTAEASGLLPEPSRLDELERITRWAGQTNSGDIGELVDIPEDSPIWPLVTSTVDNCLGQECPEFADCYVMQARRAAQEADILVINHHLFFADIALREEGFSELLPGANAVVLDEAHQLPEVASNFFGVAVSSRQLLELARDSVREHLREAGDMARLEVTAHLLEQRVREILLAFGTAPGRGPWRAVAKKPALRKALAALRDSLAALQAQLELGAGRGKGLESCHRRSQELGERLERVTGAVDRDWIQWFENRVRSFAVHLTPMEVSAPFRAQVKRQKRAWVLTSATLAVGESFAHFAARLGLEDADTRRWESPFDFARQAICYVPHYLPEPRDPRHTEAVVEAARPVLAASRGRAFMLFTSHRALNRAADLLVGQLPFPLLVQGSAPKARLLERFRQWGNGVLLGTSSFWEGVDVRGEALSCVIIDKLPFAAPDDPVLQARIEALRAQGANPFLDYQLPQAVISLKQGAGRLIRDTQDRGVLMVCDPRLFSRSYGRLFLESLPPMTLTRRLEEVNRFFAQ